MDMFKQEKTRAHFIKINIQGTGHYLNLPPIPLVFTSSLVSILVLIYKLFNKEEGMDEQLDKETIATLKKVIKELKYYPPFTLIEIKNNEQLFLFKTI